MAASVEDLLLCPGIGETKVRRLHRTFREPLLKRKREEGEREEGEREE